ncbi:MAG: 2-amino-4-hydroxy-6-hydroxymethyldihydropteridine diphosphokinase [Gaiellales bacterium]
MIGTPCVVGLGGNVGDVAAAFRAALIGLDATDGVRVMAVSSVYRTEPVGGPAQEDYLNAAALLACGLDPAALLGVLQGLEAAAERVRDERWGPRTLDLDLLWWDDRRIAAPGLEVPHPRLVERRFALEPLLEVAPHAKAPDGTPYADVLRDLPAAGVARLGPAALVYDPT